MEIINFFRCAFALRSDGWEKPWRIAFACTIKAKYLPHRTYKMSDHEGNIWKPPLKQWNIGRRLIWQEKRAPSGKYPEMDIADSLDAL